AGTGFGVPRRLARIGVHQRQPPLSTGEGPRGADLVPAAVLSYLADYADHFGPLRLLRYITVRTALAALTSLIIGFAIGPTMIRKFKELKFGHGYIDDRTGSLGASYFDK